MEFVFWISVWEDVEGFGERGVVFGFAGSVGGWEVVFSVCRDIVGIFREYVVLGFVEFGG